MAIRTVKRNLTFVAWADASERKPFDLDVAAKKLTKIQPKDLVLAHAQHGIPCCHQSVYPGTLPAWQR